MSNEIHIHVHPCCCSREPRTKVLELLEELKMSIDELKAKVDAETTVNKSAIALLNGLAAQLREIATDPAKVQALADQLDANTKELSEAVTANTPATP